jgi:hypothetical protein
MVGPEKATVRVAELEIVDRTGRVDWGRGDWRAISLAQLLRSCDAGALPGDPRGIALMGPRRGAGGVVAAWESFSGMGSARPRADGVRHLRTSPEDLRSGHAGTEDARGKSCGLASPRCHDPPLPRLLSRHPWYADALADLLDCSREDARSTLELFGCRQASDERYYPGEEGPRVSFGL